MLDLQERLGVFIPQVQGQYINVDYETVNEGFGAQCWDLQAFWTAFLGLPTINTGGDSGRWPGWAGNMVDCFPQTPEIAAAYELIGPDEPGMTGDIPVWGDSYYWYPKTHVAVLIQDKGAQLLCLSQNSVPAQADNPYPRWSTGPTTIQHLPRAGLIGFIRPRAGLALQGTITEDDMALTDEQAKTLAYIGSAQFKADIFAGTTQLEKDARGLFHKEALNQGVDWYGYDGKIPAEGRKTTSPAIDLGFADTRAMGQASLISGLYEVIKQLSAGKAEVDLAAVQAASAAGVKDAIDSITTTVKIEGDK